MDSVSEIMAAKDFLKGSRILEKRTNYYIVHDSGAWGGPFTSMNELDSPIQGRIVSVATTLEIHGTYKPESLEAKDGN